VKWYRLAAAQGDADAQNNLGVMSANGQGVLQDYAEAMKWCSLAAVQGNARAQLNLGNMYDNGRGVPQDYAEAVKWHCQLNSRLSAP
jgi:TPR repeat protein